MIPPNQLVEKANKTNSETRLFFKKLRKQKPSSLDVVVQSIHDEVFETIHCLECANCCKTTSPIFYQKDIDRAAKSLKMPPQLFIDKFLHVDEDKDYVLNSSPCCFLGADNYCSIYPDRPTACREYPHTNRKRFFQLLDLTLKNTSICPAAYEIVARLKEAKFK